jgi:hypothetical protein
MKMQRFNQWLLVTTSLVSACCCMAEEVPVIFNHDLRKMKVAEVPEEVVVEYLHRDKKGTEKRIRAFILESVPSTWKVPASSKLSVSDKYSKAGVKSIRWDWKAGDALRIKGLRGLSEPQFKRSAPYRISIYQKQPLPRGTTIRIFHFNEKSRVHRTPGFIKDVYWMTYSNWYTMSNVEYRNPNHQRLDALPEGSLRPAADELIIRAPGNVKSGTFYLDRLLIGQGNVSLSGQEMPDVVRDGIPDKPFDPTAYVAWDNHGMTVYYGKFARRDPVPDTLTAEQQKFIDKVRGGQKVDLESPLLQGIQHPAERFLRDVLIKQEDGSYKYPEHLNLTTYGGVDDPLIFPGDHMAGGMKTLKYPWLSPEDRTRVSLLKDIWLWARYPSCIELELKIKATLDWYRYHGYESGKQSSGNWHGVYMNRDLPELAAAIPVLKAKGTARDLEYARYLAELIKWGSFYNNYLQAEKPGAVTEVGVNALASYQTVLIEPDDRTLYRDLDSFRKRWNRTIAISDWGTMSMIKPDYSFFHHGHLIGYWGGNYPGYATVGLKIVNTPLESDEDYNTYKNLAEHSIRLLYTMATIHDINPWLNQSFGKLAPAVGERKSEELMNNLYAAHERDIFSKFYQMDWDKVPAVKKYVASILRDYHLEPETLAKFHEKYPKTKAIKPAEQFHLSVNWSATSVYVKGMSKVHARSYSDIGGSVPEVERPCLNIGHRAFGALFVHESSLVNGDGKDRGFMKAHLGGNPYGYDWSRTSGVTMPKLSMAEVREIGPVGFGGHRLKNPENEKRFYGGSVTFGETDSELGGSGNQALHIRPETTELLKSKFGFRFFGSKSYHFLKDQVICLGSEFKTEQSPKARAMETVLFQNGLADEVWNSRDKRRWNPAAPSVVVNGKSYEGKGTTVESDLADGNYVISPYGHAWIIPAGQKGQLRLNWQDQTSLITGARTPRVEHTAEFVTAWLDHGNSEQVSSHHYCLLLNSTGKTPDAFTRYVEQNRDAPRYKVLRQDDVAHAVYGNDDALFSYIIFKPNTKTGLPHIDSAERRLNIMVKEKAAGTLELAIADPTIGLCRQDGGDKQSPAREVRLQLPHKNCRVVKAVSGLPQTNPPLQARIEGNDKNILVYQTRNGVPDTFIIKY